MTEEKINKFINELFAKKFTKTYSHTSDSYNQLIIDEQGRTIVEDMIRSFLRENHEEQKGILEAKVFMYEEIISKSNFAPLLPNYIYDTKNEENKCVDAKSR